MTASVVAKQGTILRAVVGSTLHGLALEGTDDRDEMGVCIEPPEYVIGLRQFEQWVYRTKPEGVRSEAGDLDLAIYSLRKYARLALNGNPTILLLLFAPPEYLLDLNEAGAELQALAPSFASKRAIRAFLGYLTAQKQRLLGERGQKRTKRPELEAAHGYDTKYAMHMLRLGYQGVEFGTTGRLTLPMDSEVRDHVMAVRRGELDLNHVLTAVGELEAELEGLLITSPLPDQPEREVVDDFLIRSYREAWA
jgi:uncharacterized protein